MRLICKQKNIKIGSTKCEHYARKIGSTGARAAPRGWPGIGPRREACRCPNHLRPQKIASGGTLRLRGQVATVMQYFSYNTFLTIKETDIN